MKRISQAALQKKSRHNIYSKHISFSINWLSYCQAKNDGELQIKVPALQPPNIEGGHSTALPVGHLFRQAHPFLSRCRKACVIMPRSGADEEIENKIRFVRR